MNTKKLFVVILAGGSGTRLRPLSTSDFPKQFVCLEDNDKTLLQNTIQRCKLIQNIETHIIISTNDKYENIVQKQIENMGDIDIIKEPYKRNTAPAILFTIKYLLDQK